MIKLESYLEKPLSRFIIWCLIGLSIMFFGILNVKADTITDYKYQFRWFEYDDTNGEDVQNGWTSYHTPSETYTLVLYGKEYYVPTYDLWQYMSGFDTVINRPISKGVSYTVNVNFNFTSISNSEFRSSSLSRFTDSANVRISNANYTYGSISYNKNSCFTYSSESYCTYNVSATYSFVATVDASSFQLGSWVSTGAGYGYFEHYLTSSYNLTSISFEKNADNTIINQNQTIINQNQQTNEELSDINDNLTNSDVTGVEDSFEQFEGFLEDNSTITQLITLPITLYSSILNNIGGSCQPFNLGSLYGENLVLPCVNIGNYLGSTLWGMIDLIISGFAVYFIAKKLIKVFNNFSSMKDGDVIDD